MTRNRPRLSRLHVIAVVATLAWVLGAGLYSAWNNSMTSDEGVHAASGYLVLTRHEFRFDPEHPYLFKIISALPLLAVRLNPPSDDQRLWNAAWPSNYDSWKEARQWADEWFYNSG
ncbi:hypothetical protein KGQ71_04325, partial [Patescibacteria group bacterium]|nr:hypothetical protein [Patescibacteria group bacterium]